MDFGIESFLILHKYISKKQQSFTIKSYNLKMSQLTVFLRHAKRSNTKNLSLENREILSIPKQVYTIKSIEILNLENNRISQIDPSITNLFRLRELNLKNNNLSELPKQITEIPMLNVLALKGNPLKGNFKTLLELDLIDNVIEKLHECFEGQQKKPIWASQQQEKPMLNLAFKTNSFPKNEEVKVMGRTTSQGFRRKQQSKQQQFQPERQTKNGIIQLHLKDLEIGQQISMGGFSTIHKGRYFGLEVAIKKTFNPKISQQLIDQFQNQISILSKYRHPNVVLMVGAITRPPTLCIVMEMMKEGTLYDLIHKRKVVLSDAEKTHISKQLVDVYYYLHEHGIVHRDIKSHNVLIDQYYNIKICDFGLAKHKSNLNTGPMQFSGTPTYMAPQMFLKRSYTEAVDIFALATLLYEIYYGEIPFVGMDPADIKDKVLKNPNFVGKINIKKSVTQILNKCRALEPSERPPMAELVKFTDW